MASNLLTDTPAEAAHTIAGALDCPVDLLHLAAACRRFALKAVRAPWAPSIDSIVGPPVAKEGALLFCAALRSTMANPFRTHGSTHSAEAHAQKAAARTLESPNHRMTGSESTDRALASQLPPDILGQGVRVAADAAGHGLDAYAAGPTEDVHNRALRVVNTDRAGNVVQGDKGCARLRGREGGTREHERQLARQAAAAQPAAPAKMVQQAPGFVHAKKQKCYCGSRAIGGTGAHQLPGSIETWAEVATIRSVVLKRLADTGSDVEGPPVLCAQQMGPAAHTAPLPGGDFWCRHLSSAAWGG